MLSRLDRPLEPLEIDTRAISHGSHTGFSGVDSSVCGVTVHVLDQSGNVEEQSGVRLLDLAQRLWPGGAHKSYFRSLTNVADNKRWEFSLKIERHAIIVRSDMMRALVEPTRAVLFGADAHPVRFITFLDEMTDCVRACAMSEEHSFERSVVESIVCAHVTMQTMRFKVLKPVALEILSGARQDNSHDAVMELYPVQVALSSFVERLRPVVRSLRKLESWGVAERRTQGFSAGDGPKSLGRSDEAYGLLAESLETWHNSAKEVFDDATELVSNLADAMSFIESSMDCYRNRLIKLDYTVMVPTMALTFANLVCAVFGMNLDGGGRNPNDFINETGSINGEGADGTCPVLEIRELYGVGLCGALFWLEKGWFEYALLLMFVVMIAICAVMLRAVNRSRKFYTANSAKFGNNQFFSKVGDDDYILSLASSSPPEVSAKQSADQEQILPEVLADLARPAQPVTSRSGARRRSAPARPDQSGTSPPVIIEPEDEIGISRPVAIEPENDGVRSSFTSLTDCN